MSLKDEFKRKPFLKGDILEKHFDELKRIENEITKSLKDCPGFEAIDFCDVGAKGIQIRGFHKDVKGYCYGEQVTIKYDFSNSDIAIDSFIEMWKREDTAEKLSLYQGFLADGEKYGWD